MTGDREEKAWAKILETVAIDEVTGCWEWQGGRQKYGYGQLGFGERWLPRLVHRAVWTIRNGPIPKGLHVLHLCDNPPCCNPAHLVVGPPLANASDMWMKRRAVIHVGEKHPNAKLSDADVRRIRERYARGGISQRALARALGLPRSTVRSILLGERRNIASKGIT